MQQPSLFPPPSLSVSEITRYLQQLFESDEILSDIWVRGEVSNLSRPASGHVYFTLKDTGSALKCVIWKTTAFRLPITLQNGMAIEAHGAVGIYERDGQYQLYVNAVRLTGEGALYQEFLRLKARLEAEGLFDEERKKPLPALPGRIGIVTSATGAALQDILNTLRRRYPLAEVVLAPCAVQGEEAVPQIVGAINALNAEDGVDVILVARGGGSLEDLWAFNEELVVRAIANSRVPIISGIGHETDVTLADFAADLRAPTPTAAAEQAVPDREVLMDELAGLTSRLGHGLQLAAAWERGRLAELKARMERVSPSWRLRSDLQRLDELSLRLGQGLQTAMQRRSAEIRHLEKQLSGISPYAVLQRGYAIVTDIQGGIISQAGQVERDQVIDVRVSDGNFLTRVITGENQDGEVHHGKE